MFLDSNNDLFSFSVSSSVSFLVLVLENINLCVSVSCGLQRCDGTGKDNLRLL